MISALSSSQTAGVPDAPLSLADLWKAISAGLVPLPPESAGYLLLAIADQLLRAPLPLDERGVLLSPEGTVSLLALTTTSRSANGDGATLERQLRDTLRRLLAQAPSAAPALSAITRRPPQGHLEPLIRELEAALIPVNRAAGRRSLARLQREVERVRHRIAGVPMPPLLSQAPAQPTAPERPQPAARRPAPPPAPAPAAAEAERGRPRPRPAQAPAAPLPPRESAPAREALAPDPADDVPVLFAPETPAPAAALPAAAALPTIPSLLPPTTALVPSLLPPTAIQLATPLPARTHAPGPWDADEPTSATPPTEPTAGTPPIEEAPAAFEPPDEPTEMRAPVTGVPAGVEGPLVSPAPPPLSPPVALFRGEEREPAEEPLGYTPWPAASSLSPSAPPFGTDGWGLLALSPEPMHVLTPELLTPILALSMLAPAPQGLAEQPSSLTPAPAEPLTPAPEPLTPAPGLLTPAPGARTPALGSLAWEPPAARPPQAPAPEPTPAPEPATPALEPRAAALAPLTPEPQTAALGLRPGPAPELLLASPLASPAHALEAFAAEEPRASEPPRPAEPLPRWSLPGTHETREPSAPSPAAASPGVADESPGAKAPTVPLPVGLRPATVEQLLARFSAKNELSVREANRLLKQAVGIEPSALPPGVETSGVPAVLLPEPCAPAPQVTTDMQPPEPFDPRPARRPRLSLALTTALLLLGLALTLLIWARSPGFFSGHLP